MRRPSLLPLWCSRHSRKRAKTSDLAEASGGPMSTARIPWRSTASRNAGSGAEPASSSRLKGGTVKEEGVAAEVGVTAA